VGWIRVIQDGIQLQSVETKNISRLVKEGEIYLLAKENSST
jgi:hypothetical protein